MSLRGDLSTIPLDDVFGWIASRGKRGRVVVRARSVERSFHLDGACITSSSSSFEDEHLGRILVDQGLIEQAAMDKAYSVHAETQVQLGKVLILIDAIDQDTLRAAISNKIVDAVADVLTWPTGTIEFEPGPKMLGSSELHVRVDVDACLVSARERALRWRKCRAQVPTMQTRFWVVELGERNESLGSLFDAVAEGLTGLEIARRLHQPKLEVVELLAGLVAAGVLAVERRTRNRRTTDSPPGLEDLVSAGRGRADGGDVLGALELASMAAAMYVDDPRAESLVGELRARAAGRIAVEMLSRSRIPLLKATMDELEFLGLDEVELQCARAVDGTFDLWALVERSSVGWVPALIAFKRLAVRDIISV